MTFDSIEKRLVASALIHNTPISGSLELIPLCNMDCDMCYVRLNREEMQRHGRLLTSDEWIEIGKQMVESGVLFLQITGGEPLLYQGFRKVYLALKQMGIILTLNTNGTLIDESWAGFFAQHKPRRINITLYGADAQVYKSLCHYENGFDSAIRAIKLLKARGIDVKINGSLVKANQPDIQRLFSIAQDLDAPINIDTYMYPATRERERAYDWSCRLTPKETAGMDLVIWKYQHPHEDFQEYARQFLYKSCHPKNSVKLPNRMKCMAGRSSFFLNWRGGMQPCVMLPAVSVSVKDHGFAESWTSIAEYVKSVVLSPTCAECSKRDVCRTCAACALYESGSMDGVPGYICEYTDWKIKYMQDALMHE